MQPFWGQHFYLPSQEHPHSRAVSESLENAREKIAFLAGCEPFEIVFTGGGTEANNLAILGTTQNADPGHAVTTPIEHDSIAANLDWLATRGWEIDEVGCDDNGRISASEFESLLREDTKLACVQLANPILGTTQPIIEIADACRTRGVHLHCDATQAFGKLSVDANQLGVDTMSISGHKFYGPKGSGAIYVRRGLSIEPIRFGEPREMGLRPGSENVPACIGIGSAAGLTARCIADVESTFQLLSDRLITGIQTTLNDNAIILAPNAERIPNTVCLELPIEANRAQQLARDLVVTTAQSSNPADEMTRVLRAIGRSESQIARTIRISMGWTTSRDEVDQTIRWLAEACDTATG